MNIINYKSILFLIYKPFIFLNGLGNKHKCYICGASFFKFSKYRKGLNRISNFRKKLNIIGSDVTNYKCIYCGCNDRERHLFMFFDKIKFWDNIPHPKILHFAPEKHLSMRIFRLHPIKYIMADLNPQINIIYKINATNIPYETNTFDIVIANHVLEHILEYRMAISEFFRILRPGGIAILQTPFSRLLKKNFEDENINNDQLRLYFSWTGRSYKNFFRISIISRL